MKESKFLKFDAVLFDCDGVLVDSESITNGVLRDMLAELGWALSSAECMRLFIGKAVKDEVAQIEAHTGHCINDAWLAEFRDRRNQGLALHVKPIAGAVEAVAQIYAAYDARIACASGADRFKVQLQLEKCGLSHYFAGRIFSGYEMPRSKPAPDVYLAAAQALGVDPTRCAVIEDTVTGVIAGVAAGATVLAYNPDGIGYSTPQALLAAGAAQVCRHWHELVALL